MAEYSKYNIVYRLQKWMDSVPGQTFLNYAYSWGASIVIFGTLCKLTHLPGANFWLFLGMGTEVFVFFISAFDRPFDKTADGRDLPTHVEDAEEDEDGAEATDHVTMQAPQAVIIGGSGVIHAGGGVAVGQPGGAACQPAAAADGLQPSGSVQIVGGSAAGVVGQSMVTPVVTGTAENEEMVQAQSDYVAELKRLVETLGKVNEQSSRLATDSLEMENLNRTLTGISRVYEMQLKSASQQISTIDQINEQSKKMAQQIEQLNQIYSRMIEAMTLNMQTRNPGQ
ncbi:MAG: gliding motility protein GldL [Prevotella sp.]|uniref:type IX secretion system motor protein PorL/GldL n=1 Tax=Prevotella sp. P4-67 TaxID=2024227 RepID=UPI000B97540D|nr:gliding motility protein GldL [Prevotella sp. P4-67]MEE0619785.1 gliding motility protein GldL [Prevotella sp.]OYP75893.1 gliding motility protein GldL [Prevotella sp. P4-67]